MLHMTVKGKYVYEIRWINGDIEFEDQGTVDKPKPKIEAVDIINKTSDTITVKVSTLRNEGGTLKYYIQEENAEYTFVTEQTEEEYTFAIDANKTYTKIKVEAIAKNGETASKEVEIVNIPTLTEKTVTLSYEVNGEIIDETDWTQGPVVVTVSTETEGYTLQTSQDEGKTWKDAEIAEQEPSTATKISSRATTRTVTKSSVQKSTQTFATNGTLYARLIDKTTGQKGKEYTKKITNIDKLAPDTFTPTATSTTNSITLTGSTEDATATNENASSGIKEYWFAYSDDNGATWKEWVTNTLRTQTSYTFNNLTQNKAYSLKMKAIDNAGNETTTETVTKTTGSVPTLTDSNTTFTYTPSIATNTEVTVTIETTVTGYTLQYSTDGTNWTDYIAGIKFTKNGAIHARVKDSTEQGGTYVTGNVTNIDKLAPKTFTPTATSTTNSITLTGSTEDATATNENASTGIKAYYFSKDNGATWEPKDGQTGTSYTFNDLTQNESYSLKMKAVDNAGNETTTETVTKTTGTVPSGEGNITFSYSNTNWTKDNVDVTITKKAGNDAYKLQYLKDNGEWTDITSGGKVTFTANGSITARLADTTTEGKTGNVGAIATGNVTKIDKVKPTITTALASSSTTTNSITVKTKVQDKKSSTTSTTETVSGLGKIIWYYKIAEANGGYTKITDTYQASGATAGATTEQEKTKTFSNLTANTQYNIYVEVYDVAGNMTRSPASGTVNATTGEVPSGGEALKFDYSTTDWTNGNVDVTITKNTGYDAYKIQYTTDGKSWTEISSGGKVRFTANGSVSARLRDVKSDGTLGNTGVTATGNVTKIDKVKPTVGIVTNSDTHPTYTHNSISIPYVIQDKKSTNAPATETVSGLGKIICYYKKSTASTYTSATTTYRASGPTAGSTNQQTITKTFSNLDAGTTYNIYVAVYDVAGNMTRYPSSGTTDVTTLATYTVSYNANGGTGAPASQPKIHGKDLTLSSTKPTRKDWVFLGWGVANRNVVLYNPGSTYTDNADASFDAIWGLSTTNGATISNYSTSIVSTGFKLPSDAGTASVTVNVKYNRYKW